MADDQIPDVTASYDSGMFDKDEQGWVSSWTTITQAGPLVRVSRNDCTTEGRIERWYRALGLVVLCMADGHVRHFDLGVRRLLDRPPVECSRELGPLAPTMDGIASLVRAAARAGAALDARIGALAGSFDPARLTFERPDETSPYERATQRLGPAEDLAAIEVVVWRDGGATLNDAFAKTAAPSPAGSVSLALQSGRASIQVHAPLEVQEEAVAAARSALSSEGAGAPT